MKNLFLRTNHTRRRNTTYVLHRLLRCTTTNSVAGRDIDRMHGQIRGTECGVHRNNAFNCTAVIPTVTNHACDAERHIIQGADNRSLVSTAKEHCAAGSAAACGDCTAAKSRKFARVFLNILRDQNA